MRADAMLGDVSILCQIREGLANVVALFAVVDPDIADRAEYIRLVGLVHDRATDNPRQRINDIGRALVALVGD